MLAFFLPAPLSAPADLRMDDQSAFIPDSFLKLYAGMRGRLLRPLPEVRVRYDLCDDLAHHLVASAQALHHDQGLSEDMVLERCLRGLQTPDAGMNEGEPLWVVRRLAELLNWPCDGLASADQ
jgi:hypothetical protein